MNFRQKGAFGTVRLYTIEKEGVRMNVKSPLRKVEKFYDFRIIGKELVKKESRPWLLSIPLAIGILFAGLLLTDTLMIPYTDIFAGLSLLLSGISLIIFFLIDSKYIFLMNQDSQLGIPFLNEDELSLNAFLKSLRKAQRIRLQHKFLTFDENMSYEDYCQNVKWLRDNDFLSKKEAEIRLGETEEQLKQA